MPSHKYNSPPSMKSLLLLVSLAIASVVLASASPALEQQARHRAVVQSQQGAARRADAGRSRLSSAAAPAVDVDRRLAPGGGGIPGNQVIGVKILDNADVNVLSSCVEGALPRSLALSARADGGVINLDLLNDASLDALSDACGSSDSASQSQSDGSVVRRAVEAHRAARATRRETIIGLGAADAGALHALSSCSPGAVPEGIATSTGGPGGPVVDLSALSFESISALSEACRRDLPGMMPLIERIFALAPAARGDETQDFGGILSLGILNDPKIGALGFNFGGGGIGIGRREGEHAPEAKRLISAITELVGNVGGGGTVDDSISHLPIGRKSLADANANANANAEKRLVDFMHGIPTINSLSGGDGGASKRHEHGHKHHGEDCERDVGEDDEEEDDALLEREQGSEEQEAAQEKRLLGAVTGLLGGGLGGIGGGGKKPNDVGHGHDKGQEKRLLSAVGGGNAVDKAAGGLSSVGGGSIPLVGHLPIIGREQA